LHIVTPVFLRAVVAAVQGEDNRKPQNRSATVERVLAGY